MVVKRFNKVKFITFIVIVLLVIAGITYGIVTLINFINYRKSNEFKLLTYGYSVDQVEILLDELNESEINDIMTRKKDDILVDFINQRYFIYENLDKYLEYHKRNLKMDKSKIVAIINTEANIEWIDTEKESDTSLNELMLVNRLYSLGEYVPDDIVNVPVKYAYSGKKLSNSVIDKLIELCDAASLEGYTFVVSDGYRSYKEQKKLYDSYAKSYGKSEADKIIARPGHSEYQTGLSFDLVPYNKTFKNPKESNEYKWLRDNAYKYGFIFRFQEDKEYLTGFKEYTWRLRYVGEDAANIMYDEEICFEEYYAYYVGRDNNE